MKYEGNRRGQMKEAIESRIDKLEEGIVATRDRLSHEKEILTKHEITLNRKNERGVEVGITQERLDKKKEVITLLETKLEEMEVMAQLLRGQFLRLLSFNPVQDALDNLPPKFRLVRGREWEVTPGSPSRTFQDIFTPPEARIVPNYKRGPSYSEYQRQPIDPCPVDPAYIPDWFMDEFELGRLDGLSDFEKLERKAEAIPEVKNIFKHLQPLNVYGRKSQRIMVMQDYDEDHDGKVLVTSYTGRQKKEDDRKTMQVFDSAYEAHRRMIHADQGYEMEQEKLDGIKGRTKGVLGDTKGVKKDDPRREQLSSRIESELEILGKVLSYHKVEAADILADVSSLKDSRDRHNPGAACCRIVKVIDLLEARLPQIYHKSRYVNDDKKMLNKSIHMGRGALEEARVASLNLCEALENGSDGSEIVRNVSLMPELEDLKLRPFSLYAAKFAEKKEELKAALLAGDKKAFRDAAINAYVACKTFEVQHERERILRDIAASPMQTSIESLLERVKRLLGIVASKETFRDVRTGHNEAYREMSAKVNNTVKGLETYHRMKLTESERLAMYERLKAYLEEIDFTEILEKL